MTRFIYNAKRLPELKQKLNVIEAEILRCFNAFDDVCVIVYIDDVLDDPIEITKGNGKSRLRLTIQANGTVSYAWTEEAWTKVLKDSPLQTHRISKNIVAIISKHMSTLLANVRRRCLRSKTTIR